MSMSHDQHDHDYAGEPPASHGKSSDGMCHYRNNHAMKTAKKSNKRKGGNNEPSILDYFSKSKRKKSSTSKSDESTPSSSFGTPVTPNHAAHLSGAINGSETPTSVVSADTAALESSSKANPIGGSDAASRDNANWEGTRDTSTPISGTTPETHEPDTPPSTAAARSLAIHINDGLSAGPRSPAQSAQPTETPPSNDTMSTTPSSPPTPASSTLADCQPNDHKGNHSGCTKRNHVNSKFKEDVEDAPKSLLESRDMPAQNDTQQRQPRSVNMGTPSTTCNPSTKSASLNMDTPSTSCTPSTTVLHAAIKKVDQTPFFTSKHKANKSTKKQKKSNQLFLDFGQNSFGKQSICSICGMLRVHGLEEDDAQHAKVCKEYKQGVSCLGWKNERLSETFGKDDRILEVRPDDSQQHKNKVLEVKKIVDKELGFANRKNDDLTAYMYISKKKVVGLLMVKRIQRAYELLPSKESGDNDNSIKHNPSQSSISRSLKPSKALLGIHQIWVHNSHRHRGIASKLVTAARDHLIFGMMVPFDLVAFSSPTEEGLRFAKSYVGSERPLIYDIH